MKSKCAMSHFPETSDKLSTFTHFPCILNNARDYNFSTGP